MKNPFKKFAKLTIITKKNERILLIDKSSGIKINPITINLENDRKYLVFKDLWLGDFDLHTEIRADNIPLNTNRATDFKEKGLVISVTHYRRLIFFPKTISKIFASLHNWLFKFGWDYVFKISKIISVCEYLNKEVKANLAKEGVVIPIPIDESDYPKDPKDLRLKHPSALLIQNHQIKQKSEALVSFKEVIRALPKVTFYISQGLPENRDNKYYKAVLDALSSLENVKFVDINTGNKYDYLSSTDFYILRSGLDCTPATILEAGLASKPVIASAVGGVPEMIVQGKTGWTINNYDTGEWINHIEKLLAKNALTQSMGAYNQTETLAKYSINRISKDLLQTITL